MRLRSNPLTTVFFFIAAVLLLVLISTQKPATALETSRASGGNTITRYIEEAEKKNEQERDEKEKAYALAKLAKAKKDSVECQFWTQQHARNTNTRTTEKIAQYCSL